MASIQEVAASQFVINSSYYQEVRRQARSSFQFALISAFIGLLFFIAAIIPQTNATTALGEFSESPVANELL